MSKQRKSQESSDTNKKGRHEDGPYEIKALLLSGDDALSPRRKRSAYDVPWHDVQLIHGDRLQMPCAHENHACSFSFLPMVEMSFSS